MLVRSHASVVVSLEGKPVVRRGRKASGLEVVVDIILTDVRKIAGLPVS